MLVALAEVRRRWGLGLSTGVRLVQCDEAAEWDAVESGLLEEGAGRQLASKLLAKWWPVADAADLAQLVQEAPDDYHRARLQALQNDVGGR